MPVPSVSLDSYDIIELITFMNYTVWVGGIDRRQVETLMARGLDEAVDDCKEHPKVVGQE